MRHVLTTICFLSFSASAAHADLRYTTRVEVRRTAAQSAKQSEELGAALRALMPPGETATFVNGETVRIEHSNGATRSILLLRPDGQILIDPDTRTYRRLPDIRGLLAGSASLPAPAFRRTGEFATVLGLRAERIDVTMSVTLPATPPPGFPTVMAMTGELWLADAHRAYAKSLRAATGLAGDIPAGLEGIVLRQILRNAEFGIEIEYTVTDFVEGPVASDLFEVPPGYRRQP